MPVFDFICTHCEDVIELNVKYQDRDSQVCPICNKELDRVWLKAPYYGQLGPEGSSKNIDAMKKSFHERFVKKDMDQVRHKFGNLFDESLVSAAVNRIREGKA